MLRAAERGRARAAHQERDARKNLELASLVLTQLQHWRGQIIAAHARAPPRGVHIQQKKQKKSHRNVFQSSQRFIPEQPVTNFNGDGVNTHTLKNVV